MRKVTSLLIATSLMTSTVIFAQTSQHTVSGSVTTPHTSVNANATVENSNVLQKIGQKTVSTLDKAGTATAHGIDKGVTTVVDKSKNGWENTKQFSKEKASDGKAKLSEIKTSTQDKTHHAKDWTAEKASQVKTDAKHVKNAAEDKLQKGAKAVKNAVSPQASSHKAHVGVDADASVQHNHS